MGSQNSRLHNAHETEALRNSNMVHSGNSLGSFNEHQLIPRTTNSINTVFHWSFGANNVQLTGTFNDWINPIPLNRTGNNTFEVILKLSPGVYQYKYIVDGEWRFSPDDPTCKDEVGNINNIIDTTNIERSMSLIGAANNSIGSTSINSQQINYSSLMNTTNQIPNATSASSQYTSNTAQQPLQHNNNYHDQNFNSQQQQQQQQQQYHLLQHQQQQQQQQLFQNQQQQISVPQTIQSAQQQQLLLMQFQQNQQLIFQQQQQQQLQPLQQLIPNLGNDHNPSNPTNLNANVLLLQQLLMNSRMLGQPIAVQQQYEQLLQQQLQMSQGSWQSMQEIDKQLQQLLHQQQMQLNFQLSQQQPSHNLENIQQIQSGTNQNNQILQEQQLNQSQLQQQQQQQQSKYLQKANGITGGNPDQQSTRGLIAQQNNTNFDLAFKETAPLLPPHLLSVPAITKRDVQQISIWREKEPHEGIASFKSIFKAKKSSVNEIEEENVAVTRPSQGHASLVSKEDMMNKHLANTPSDDAEVLMQIFQPGHSLTQVDHVTLNHVGFDNHRHRNQYSVYCVTQRFKTKYTTYKFYSSNNDTKLIA